MDWFQLLVFSLLFLGVYAAVASRKPDFFQGQKGFVRSLALGFLVMFATNALLPQQTTTGTAEKGTEQDTQRPTQGFITPASKGVALESCLQVHTDVMSVWINPVGGDMVQSALLDYQAQQGQNEPKILLQDTAASRYVVRSGIQSAQGPNFPDNREPPLYRAKQQSYVLANDQDRLVVALGWTSEQGVEFQKNYIFHRGRYDVDVEYLIHNRSTTPFEGRFYGMLEQKPEPEKKTNWLMRAYPMYKGAAVQTESRPYQRVSYQDMTDKPFRQTHQGGWAAFSERYFLTAWVPAPQESMDYFTHAKDDTYQFFVSSKPFYLQPGEKTRVAATVYSGPEQAATLKALSKGLELNIDYGFFSPIAEVLYWGLKSIYGYVHNWGIAICLLTVFIKLVFFPILQQSMRSSHKMRLVQPKLEEINTRYAHDREARQKAIFELMRKEKVNPALGCLPPLLQIPVFIALIPVLSESIELRHAPFMLWIHDLSASDPLYIMPLVMGATLWLQMRMMPKPSDPVQATMFMYMPILFTAISFAFPSGLLLYWTVSNVFSIFQQWIVQRAGGTALRR